MLVTHSACMLRSMPRAIQIRDVPDEVHSTLRSRAAAAGMSLSEYLLREVTEMAARPSVADVLRRAQRRSGGAAVTDIVAAVRDGRERD